MNAERGMRNAESPAVDKPTQLRRLPVGARFEDFYGKQVFEKIGVCSFVSTRRTQQIIRCEKSPFTKLPGPVCAAFFCAVGDVVYKGGNLMVYPIEAQATPKAESPRLTASQHNAFPKGRW